MNNVHLKHRQEKENIKDRSLSLELKIKLKILVLNSGNGTILYDEVVGFVPPSPRGARSAVPSRLCLLSQHQSASLDLEHSGPLVR